jgi:hypothetical protein
MQLMRSRAVQKGTPAAKAFSAQTIYGTAEAVPFVERSLFPQRVKRVLTVLNLEPCLQKGVEMTNLLRH